MSRVWEWAKRFDLLAGWFLPILKWGWPVLAGLLGVVLAFRDAYSLTVMYFVGLSVTAVSLLIVSQIQTILVKLQYRRAASAMSVARRQQLIDDWRAMVSQIEQEQQMLQAAGETRYVWDTVPKRLESHSAFLSLRPHLSDEARRMLWLRPDEQGERNKLIASERSGMEMELLVVLREIERLEKEWGL
jgi:hypothetical protein